MEEIIFVTGLPRSGSTLLCNLLAQHPEIAGGPSSPLCHVVQSMRRQWSDDAFLLSQMDANFDEVYERLERSAKAFMDAWCESDKKFVLDKNRAWLTTAELVRSLYSNMKMIVCLRDPRSIFASIERQHRKTLMLDFPDHMDSHIVDNRASSLFDNGGVVGAPLKALNNLGDLPNISKHIFIFRYEDFAAAPQNVMENLLTWMGAESFKFNLADIKQITHESDSYHRFKYSHKIKSKFVAAKSFAVEDDPISPRILEEIVNRFAWFYSAYYNDYKVNSVSNVASQDKSDLEVQIAQEVEEALNVLDMD